MNFRKVTSAIAALAISCASFVGLTLTAEAATVGATDYSSGYLGAISDVVTLSVGESVTFTFTNHTNQEQTWYNWMAGVCNTDITDYSDQNNYLVRLRPDNWADVGGSVTSGNINWSTFKADMDGAQCTVTFTNKSDGIYIYGISGDSSSSPWIKFDRAPTNVGSSAGTYTAGADVKVFMTIHNGNYLTDLKYTNDAYSESYSSTSTTTGWSTANSDRFIPSILNEDDNYFLSVEQTSRNNNGTTVTGTVLQHKVAAGESYTMTFDMRLSSSTNQQPTSFTIYAANNSSTVLSLTATGTWATTWKINGTDTQVTLPNSNKGNSTNTIADVTWCSYKLEVDADNGKTYLTITNKATGITIFPRAEVSDSTPEGGLGKMYFVSSRYLANFAIDNINVQKWSTPSVSVTDSNSDPVSLVMVQEGGTETVNVAYPAGDAITCTSSDPDITTATESDGVITVTGVSEGMATITVTDTTFHGLTATTTFDVTVGDIPVSSITVNYKNGDTVVKTVNEDVTGLYVGDGYTYKSVNYVQDTSGNYYYVAADESANATYSGKDTSRGHYALRKTGTYTRNTVIEYSVTRIADDVVYYAEGEDIQGLSSTDSSPDRYVPAGGKTGSGNTAETYTVERTGTYKITIALCGGNYATGLFRTAAYASAATSYNAEGSLIAMSPLNNQYGYVYVTTADLTAGEVLTLKGFRTNGNVTPVDYMIVKDVTTGKVAATVDVTDSNGTPVSGATVDIAGYTAAETATSGTYEANVPKGTHTVTVSKVGYLSNTGSVVVSDGGSNTTTVALTNANTVTYNLGTLPSGCTYSGETTESVLSGSSPVSVPVITDNLAVGGGVFLGWSETEGGSIYVDPASQTISDDKTYYAVFSDTITASKRFYASEDSNEIGTAAGEYEKGFNTDNPEICLHSGSNRGFISFDNLDTTNAVGATMNVYITQTPTDKARTYSMTFAKTRTVDWNGYTADTVNSGEGWNDNIGSASTTIATVSYDGLKGSNVTGWQSGRFTDISDMDKLYVNGNQAIDYRFSSVEGEHPEYIEIFYTGNVITAGDGIKASQVTATAGDQITFTAASGCNLYGTPSVVKTNDTSTTVSTSGSGTYSFTMPAYDVTIQCLGYSTPVEITSYYNKGGYRTDYNTTTNTVNDGYYARGFTFMTYGGGLTYNNVSVSAEGAKNAKYDTVNGAGDYSPGTSATATIGTNFTGDAIFGIVIWTADPDNQTAIQGFDPSQFTVTIN